MEINGAQAIIEALKEEGVDTIFGYPGGGIMPFYDELYKSQGAINHVLVRHEQAAVHAAESPIIVVATGSPALVTNSSSASSAPDMITP